MILTLMIPQLASTFWNFWASYNAIQNLTEDLSKLLATCTRLVFTKVREIPRV